MWFFYMWGVVGRRPSALYWPAATASYALEVFKAKAVFRLPATKRQNSQASPATLLPRRCWSVASSARWRSYVVTWFVVFRRNGTGRGREKRSGNGETLHRVIGALKKVEASSTLICSASRPSRSDKCRPSVCSFMSPASIENEL